MSKPRRATLLAIASLLIFTSPPVAADTMILTAAADNTLFEDVSGDLSNGVGEYVFAGRTLMSALRRAVLAFDIAAALPADATITSVALTLEVTKILNDDSHTFEIRRLLTDWGEGNSNSNVMGGGMGAASAAGDATWIHTFFDTDFWATPGGDSATTLSGAKTVGDLGAYTWNSTPQMVADVQSWLDNPTSNFGWLLQGNEAADGSAKRFNSRENSDPMTVPRLTVSFDVLIFADGFESGDFSGWN